MISSVGSSTSAAPVQKPAAPPPTPAPAPVKADGNDGDADDGGSSMKITTVSSGVQAVLSSLKAGG